jgi:hypothetical protein
MNYLPIFIGLALFIVTAPVLFVVTALAWHIAKVGVWKFFNSMPTEDVVDEKPKQYRKTIRTDPPALVRIKELGWRQGCGHSMHQWDSDRLVCLQCVLEGRVASRDLGKQ